MAFRPAVSIKGVLFLEGRVVLLRNERDEWELPGGRLDPGEQPRETVVREFREELGIEIEAGDLIDVWTFAIAGAGEVVIVAYAVTATGATDLVLSDEHSALGLFAPEELDGLRLPDGYRRAIDAVMRGERELPLRLALL